MGQKLLLQLLLLFLYVCGKLSTGNHSDMKWDPDTYVTYNSSWRERESLDKRYLILRELIREIRVSTFGRVAHNVTKCHNIWWFVPCVSVFLWYFSFFGIKSVPALDPLWKLIFAFIILWFNVKISKSNQTYLENAHSYFCLFIYLRRAFRFGMLKYGV